MCVGYTVFPNTFGNNHGDATFSSGQLTHESVTLFNPSSCVNGYLCILALKTNESWILARLPTIVHSQLSLTLIT